MKDNNLPSKALLMMIGSFAFPVIGLGNIFISLEVHRPISTAIQGLCMGAFLFFFFIGLVTLSFSLRDGGDS